MSFKKLLNQTITVFPKTGTNKYGRGSEGEGVDHPARVDLRTRTRRAANGELVTMAGQIFTLPGVTLLQGTRIDFDGQKYQIEHTYQAPGKNGQTHHIEADIVEFRG